MNLREQNTPAQNSAFEKQKQFVFELFRIPFKIVQVYSKKLTIIKDSISLRTPIPTKL